MLKVGDLVEVDLTSGPAIGTPGSWGGHAIWADTYEANWLQVTSWGEAITVDDDYLPKYAAAVYALELA